MRVPRGTCAIAQCLTASNCDCETCEAQSRPEVAESRHLDLSTPSQDNKKLHVHFRNFFDRKCEFGPGATNDLCQCYQALTPVLCRESTVASRHDHEVGTRHGQIKVPSAMALGVLQHARAVHDSPCVPACLVVLPLAAPHSLAAPCVRTLQAELIPAGNSRWRRPGQSCPARNLQCVRASSPSNSTLLLPFWGCAGCAGCGGR